MCLYLKCICFTPKTDCWVLFMYAGHGSSVGCMLDWLSGGREFAAPVQPHSFVEIDHEIFSTVILSLPLIQKGKLSVTCKKNMHWVLVNCLIGLSLPRKSVVRLTDRPNMTLAADCGCSATIHTLFMYIDLILICISYWQASDRSLIYFRWWSASCRKLGRWWPAEASA